MDIGVYIYIHFQLVFNFYSSSRPYWKTPFYDVDDRLACLNKVDLSIYPVT